MSERGGMGATTAMADKDGTTGDGSRSSDGQDCAASAFRVGDRVEAHTDNTQVRGRGHITAQAFSNAWDWLVRLDDRNFEMAFKASELTRLSDEEQPIPFELTVEAEPWSTPTSPDYEMSIVAACAVLADLLVKKRKAYGPKAIVDSPYGWEIALITRLHEKFERLVHIQKNPSDSSFEDLAESFKDLAGVAILGWIHAQEEM